MTKGKKPLHRGWETKKKTQLGITHSSCGGDAAPGFHADSALEIETRYWGYDLSTMSSVDNEKAPGGDAQ